MQAKKIKLAPSILSANFAKLGEEIRMIDKAGADYIHIDVMDGMFVPNISFAMPVIQSIRSYTEKIFDVHLMIEEPIRYIEDFKKAGADIITIHVESCQHLNKTIMAVKESGAKAGVALNPATPLHVLEYILEEADMVLIMSVNPGFAGQSYIENTTHKIKEMKKIIDNMGLDISIQVDGGITIQNVGKVINAGADCIVAGSAVFNGNIEENIRNFTKLF